MTWGLVERFWPYLFLTPLAWTFLMTIWLLVKVRASWVLVCGVVYQALVIAFTLVDSLLGNIYISTEPGVRLFVVLSATLPLPLGLSAIALKLRRLDLRATNIRQVFE